MKANINGGEISVAWCLFPFNKNESQLYLDIYKIK